MIDKDEVKRAAAGRWGEILSALGGLSAEQLNPRQHGPCPRCAGVDRFRAFDDIQETGGVICNQCGTFADGFASVGWLTGAGFSDVVKNVAAHLGIAANGNGRPRTISPEEFLEAVCRAKRMPVEHAKLAGAVVTHWGAHRVVQFPMYDHLGAPCSTFAIRGGQHKGCNAKGAPAGVFMPHSSGECRLPKAGETWGIVEGVKDKTALDGLGYPTCGLPTSSMAKKFARLFRGVNVLIFADLDLAGQEGAKKTASRLKGVAASVRIVRLPGDVVDKDGADVRDVLAGKDGEKLIRQAIEDAAPIEAGGKSEAEISNFEEVEVETPEGETKTVKTPLPMSTIIDTIDQFMGGWPRRVDKMLFVDDPEHGLSYFGRHREAGLFGLLRRRFKVDWASGGSFVSKTELFAEIDRTAKRYDAIELLPHEPPVAGVYYRGEAPKPGDGKHFAKLLDRFRPDTTIDRDLIQAAYMTVAWGGLPGCRPVFAITSDDGRGAGKTKTAEAIAYLFGGSIDLEADEEKIPERLLSPEARTKRITLTDNVKTFRYSSAKYESLVTASTISGRQMYVGEASRPNLLTWFVTLNGVSMATDMAQRSVIIKVVRGKNDGAWWEDTRRFIDQHRNEIIGDIIAALRVDPHPPATFSRWAAWEKDVLSRLPQPDETKQLILERQAEANCEADEAEIIADYFAGQLARFGYGPQRAQVRIPVDLVARWYSQAVGEPTKTASATRKLKQMAIEGQIKCLAPDPSRTYGRSFIWTGPKADVIGEPIDNDLRKRIAEKLSDEKRTDT